MSDNCSNYPEVGGPAQYLWFFQMSHTPNPMLHNPSLRCKWLHKKNWKKKDHNMSKFTHKVEILGLLSFFVSDFLGSSRLPSIIFFPPNFCVHNPSMTCKWLHKNIWEKTRPQHVQIYARSWDFMFGSVFC